MNTYQIQRRKLSIDFDLYTDGDVTFKQELIVLMMQNLRELDQALVSGAHEQDRLRGTIHKVAATISMINDPALVAILPMMRQGDVNREGLQEELKQFRVHCSEVMRSLEHELETEAVPVKAA